MSSKRPKLALHLGHNSALDISTLPRALQDSLGGSELVEVVEDRVQRVGDDTSGSLKVLGFRCVHQDSDVR